MAHFAQVIDGIVQQVIVVDEDVINSGAFGDPSTWIQTSYNTRGGIYYTPNTSTPDPDQSKAFRKNFAAIGDTYDANRDAFIPPQPYPSWSLNEFSCWWVPPIPRPNEPGIWDWDEETQSWIKR